MNTTDTTPSRPTPETDAALVDHMPKDATEWSEHYLALCIHSRRLERERDEAREQLEREQGRLAACDVVAMSDTESSRGKARDMHENYWSAAVESVIRRVDECIELRKQLEAAHDVLDADPSKIIRNAKDGYPEGRESQELTLAERVKALCIYAADWKRWCVEAGERSEAMREGIGVAVEAINEARECVYGEVNSYRAVNVNLPKSVVALTKLQPFLP